LEANITQAHLLLLLLLLLLSSNNKNIDSPLTPEIRLMFHRAFFILFLSMTLLDEKQLHCLVSENRREQRELLANLSSAYLFHNIFLLLTVIPNGTRRSWCDNHSAPLVGFSRSGLLMTRYGEWKILGLVMLLQRDISHNHQPWCLVAILSTDCWKARGASHCIPPGP
jgi:hypothetical protein